MMRIQTNLKRYYPQISNINKRAFSTKREPELPNEFQRETSPTKRNIMRWMHLKKNLMYKMFTDDVNDLRYLGPTTIIDMAEEDHAIDVKCAHPSNRYGGWRISDDEVIGGNSRADVKLVSNEGTLPFMRWSGALDTKPIGKHIDRSGFCSIRSPSFTYCGSPKLPYNALELTCRTTDPKRQYFVNLTIDSLLEENIYQAVLKTNDNPTNEFQTYVLLFRNFLQTYGGRIRENQMEIDGAVSIEHIGFTLADGVDGDFCFDLAKVRACNLFYDRVID